MVEKVHDPFGVECVPVAVGAVMPAVMAFAKRLRLLSLVAGLGGGIIWLALWDVTSPDGTTGWMLLAVALGLLLAPAAFVFLAYLALRELLELPGKVRDAPRIAVQHAAEFARIRPRPDQPASARFIGAMLVLPRVLPSILSLRELVTLAPLVRVVSPPFVILTVCAALLCLLEVLVAVPAIVWLLLSYTLIR